MINAAGEVVRRSQTIISTDDSGDTWLSYEELCDLPLGEYTIQPGAMKVTVSPDMKPLG